MKAQEDAAAAEKAKEAAAAEAAKKAAETTAAPAPVKEAAPAEPAAAAAKPAAAAPVKAAPAATVAQSLVVVEASSWVSSHFVLSLFVLLGAGLLFTFWNFQRQYSPLYNSKHKMGDKLVFTSQYYQATGVKKTY